MLRCIYCITRSQRLLDPPILRLASLAVLAYGEKTRLSPRGSSHRSLLQHASEDSIDPPPQCGERTRLAPCVSALTYPWLRSSPFSPAARRTACHTDIHTNRRTNKQTNKQTDKQTDRQTYSQTVLKNYNLYAGSSLNKPTLVSLQTSAVPQESTGPHTITSV